jgi:uncharacterized membrane protein
MSRAWLSPVAFLLLLFCAVSVAQTSGNPQTIQGPPQSEASVHELAMTAAVGTSCLCMVVLILVVAVLLLKGKLNPDKLGTWQIAGGGGGIAGLLFIFYLVIKTALENWKP